MLQMLDAARMWVRGYVAWLLVAGAADFSNGSQSASSQRNSAKNVPKKKQRKKSQS